MPKEKTYLLSSDGLDYDKEYTEYPTDEINALIKLGYDCIVYRSSKNGGWVYLERFHAQKGGKGMSEIKGQLLGIVLVLILFGAVATVMTTTFHSLTATVEQKANGLSADLASISFK